MFAAAGRSAPEQNGLEPRSTPYVGSDVRYQRPILAGDTIRSVTRLHSRVERRTARLMVFEVSATDVAGEPVATYTYTCLWDRPDGPGGPRSAETAGEGEIAAGRHSGPVLLKHESHASIATYSALLPDPIADWRSVHTDPDFAARQLFSGQVNAGVTSAAYTAEWLDAVCGPAALSRPGGRLLSRAMRPVRAGDTLSVAGREILGEAGRQSFVVLVTNQTGERVFESRAEVART